MELSLDPIQYHEYVRQNTFEIELEGLPKLAIQSGFLPNSNNDAVEVPIGNEKTYVAGKANFDTGEIVIRDSVDIQAFVAVYNWRKSVYDPVTGYILRPTAYKKDGFILQYTPDNSLIRKWLIRGAWPQAVNWGTLDQSAADVIQISVTIQYDKALPVGAN